MFPSKLVPTPSRKRVAEVSTAIPRTIATFLTIFNAYRPSRPDARAVAFPPQGNCCNQAFSQACAVCSPPSGGFERYADITPTADRERQNEASWVAGCFEKFIFGRWVKSDRTRNKRFQERPRLSTMKATCSIPAARTLSNTRATTPYRARISALIYTRRSAPVRTRSRMAAGKFSGVI
jgi:hypothetical protein